MTYYDYIAYHIHDLSSYDKSILLVISVMCDKCGRLMVTQREMARGLRMHPSNFYRKVKQLEERGFLIHRNGFVFLSDDIVANGYPMQDCRYRAEER